MGPGYQRLLGASRDCGLCACPLAGNGVGALTLIGAPGGSAEATPPRPAHRRWFRRRVPAMFGRPRWQQGYAPSPNVCQPVLPDTLFLPDLVGAGPDAVIDRRH